MPFADDGSWVSSGCRDCDSNTGGACPLHNVRVQIIPTVIIYPQIVDTRWPRPATS